MLAALLLQAAFLPEPPAVNYRPDAAYRSRLEALLQTGEINLDAAQALKPGSSSQEAVLLEFLLHGSPTQIRIAAVLGAGSSAVSPLSRAFFRAACEVRDESASLAALLAPDGTVPEDLPALGYLALAGDRPLSVRAAAVGRLLEADCAGSWPIARSILRTGTAHDEDAPWADWDRNGQYELPKRILIQSVAVWLRKHDLPAAEFEPNAAWATQVDQLKRLEPLADRARRSCRPRGNKALEDGLVKVIMAAAEGDSVATRTLSILGPHTWVYLRHPAEIDEVKCLAIARQALETAPQ